MTTNREICLLLREITFSPNLRYPQSFCQPLVQWHPTPVLLPGESHGWRSLVGCSPWGREESDTTRPSDLTFTFHFQALEKEMATHSSTLAWKISWMEDPDRLQSMGSGRVGHDWAFTFTFPFHALEKDMATHSSVLAWRIPGTGEPGGLPSMGSHRVRHDWSDLAAAAAAAAADIQVGVLSRPLDLWDKSSVEGYMLRIHGVKNYNTCCDY